MKEGGVVWFMCCCGGLPIIGLIKGALIVGPFFLILVPACIFISIIFIPHDIFFTYWTLLATPQLGPNIKVMGFFLVFIPILLWPGLVAAGAVLVGVLVGFFGPMAYTFMRESKDTRNVFISGTWYVLKMGGEWVGEFWKFNYTSYFKYLKEYREHKLYEGEKPFDIRVIDIFVGLIIAAIGVVIDGVLITILTIIKLLPAICRAYIELWRLYFSLNDCTWIFMCAIFFICANALLPAVVVLGAALCILGGFAIGVESAYVAYKFGIKKSFIHMFYRVSQFDKQTNQYIFSSKCNSFPEVNDVRV